MKNFPSHVSRRFTAAMVLACLFIALPAERAIAQPLADQVPSDALVYLGWQGADHLGAAYEESHFKAVLDASNVRDVFNVMLPSLIRKLNEEEPQAGAAISVVMSIGTTAWKHPSAFYFGGMQRNDDGSTMPKLAFYIQAGDQAKKVQRDLEKLIEESAAPMMVTTKKGLITVSVGPAPTANGTLNTNARFAATRKNLNANPVVMGYVDGEALMKLADDIAGPKDSGDGLEWQTAKSALGLDGFKQAAFSAAFQDKKWSVRAFVDAPRPRKGLLALLDAEPMGDDALKVVPKSATTVMATRFDLGRIYSEIHRAIGLFDTDALAEFDEAVTGMNDMLGFDLKKDFLDALGDQWVIYADRDTGGTGMLGYVMVNKLRKPEAFEKSAKRLQAMAGAMINQFLDDKDIRISTRELTYDGMNLNVINTPAVAPAWSVHEGHLLAAMYPQVVASAGKQLKPGSPSILESPSFIAVRKELGIKQFSSLMYEDLVASSGDGYQILMFTSQLFIGLADMAGIDTPLMIIPPLSKIRPHLSPVMAASWSTDVGWYAAMIEPFPGSSMLGSSGNLMVSQQAVAALAVGITLPALGAARRTARRMQSGTQARGIQQAAILWSASANGKFPAFDLATMYEQEYFTIEYLISPYADVEIPADIQTWKKAKRAEWINRNTSYCYVTGLTDDNDSRKIAVFEKLMNEGQDGIPVAFNDNHVEFLPLHEADALIRKQTGRSLVDWSKSKYPGAGGKN